MPVDFKVPESVAWGRAAHYVILCLLIVKVSLGGLWLTVCVLETSWGNKGDFSYNVLGVGIKVNRERSVLRRPVFIEDRCLKNKWSD